MNNVETILHAVDVRDRNTCEVCRTNQTFRIVSLTPAKQWVISTANVAYMVSICETCLSSLPPENDEEFGFELRKALFRIKSKKSLYKMGTGMRNRHRTNLKLKIKLTKELS